MSLFLPMQRRLLPVALLLIGLLTGCGGGSSNTVAPPVVDPLTNPDRIVFASGRSAFGSPWAFYAMNPDGSGVTLLPPLNVFSDLGDARNIVSLAVNQSGDIVNLTIPSAIGAVHRLVRLSDGAILFGASALAGSNIAANSTGTQIAFAGRPVLTSNPANNDPYAIYLLNPDGTHKTQVATVPDGVAVSEITFAPDDQTLYYVTVPLVSGKPLDPGPPTANGTLYKLTAGGTPVAIADIGAQIQSVHTSRDGTKLAFISYARAADASSVTFTPYTLNADGTGLTKGAVITLTGNATPLGVSIASRKDGFHVLYVSLVAGTEQLLDRRPNGSGLQEITFNAGGNGVPGTRAATTGALQMLGGR